MEIPEIVVFKFTARQGERTLRSIGVIRLHLEADFNKEDYW